MRRARVGIVALALAVSSCRTTEPRQNAPEKSAVPSVSEKAPTTPAERPRAERANQDRAPSAEAYRAVLDAELKHLAGDTAGALLDLREATLYDPESAFLRRRTAEFLLELGEIEGARRATLEALERAPDDVAARLVLARVLRIGGARDDARRVLREALAIAPGDRPASTLLAEILLEDDRIDDASSVLTDLMEKEPAAIDGYLVLADLFAQTGDHARALGAVESALERDPRAESALDQKITLLESVGRFADAVPVVEALLRETGDSKSARHKLLVALLLADRAGDAERLISAWLDDDQSEAMLGLIASAYETAGLRKEAVARLAARKDTLSTRLYAELGRLLYDDGQFGEAARVLCDPRLSTGRDGAFQAYVDATCARSLLRSGDVKGAVTHVERARRVDPHAWRLLDTLALLSRTDESGVTPEDFDTEIAKARLARDDDTDLLDVEVRALAERGRFDLARHALDDAMRTRPKNDDVMIVYAHFLELQRDGRGSAAIVRELLERSSGGSSSPDVSKLNFLAFTLADHGLDPDEALRAAWRAVLADPLNGYIVDTLGWAQKNAEQLVDARITLARAARLSPNEAEILFHQGEVELALGDAPRALAFFDAARATVAPEDVRLISRIDGAQARARARR
jgi:tetratricopeptide (TPR) repeat protein